jgi:hypothetical protein
MYLQAQVECQVYYDSESSFGVYDVKELSTGKIQSLVGVLPDLLPGEIVEGEVIEQTRYNPYMKENVYENNKRQNGHVHSHKKNDY